MGAIRCCASAAAAVGVALLAAGCAGDPASATGKSSTVSGATLRPLPRPFAIAARYTAASLGLDHPTDLAIGEDGDVYVTDLSQRVTVISPAGTVLRRWGGPGSKPGEFHFTGLDAAAPTDVEGKIAVGPDGNVYVSDSGNGRVQVFTPEGKFIRQFGRYGSGGGDFLHAFDLVVDGAGSVYVADDQIGRLSKFSRAGKVMWTIGGGASSDPDLSGFFHVASIDPHGRLVVTNDVADRVIYIDASGRKVDAFSPSTAETAARAVCEATVDAAGNTYVSGCWAPSPTLVYDRAHRLIASWPGTTYSLLRSPCFGPDQEVFALALDGSILMLRVHLPGA